MINMALRIRDISGTPTTVLEIQDGDYMPNYVYSRNVVDIVMDGSNVTHAMDMNGTSRQISVGFTIYAKAGTPYTTLAQIQTAMNNVLSSGEKKYDLYDTSSGTNPNWSLDKILINTFQYTIDKAKPLAFVGSFSAKHVNEWMY